MKSSEKIFSVILFSILLICSDTKDKKRMGSMTAQAYTYLALGDSYTIGESVPVAESFPYQAVQMLRKAGYSFHAPEIIAKTGWTTDELREAISKTIFRQDYDFVTLLIGVNNQYRERRLTEYAPEFESLLKQAIQFAGNKASHVIVISIPDWGVTPFAEGRDRRRIAREIDEYNTVNKAISQKYKALYIDITPGSRQAATDNSLLTGDGLHPSGKEYARWAENIVRLIQNNL